MWECRHVVAAVITDALDEFVEVLLCYAEKPDVYPSSFEQVCCVLVDRKEHEDADSWQVGGDSEQGGSGVGQAGGACETECADDGGD